jgi:hypothetical protein
LLKYGFLFLSYRPACFFGSVCILFVSCARAAIEVFFGDGRSPKTQFFLFGLIWTVQLLIIALYLPFDSLRRNVQNVLVGFATLAHAAFFLAVQRGGVKSSYMQALFVLFGILLILILYREKLASKAPWLRVVRREDVQKQNAAILKATMEMEENATAEKEKKLSPHHSHSHSSHTHNDGSLRLQVFPSSAIEMVPAVVGKTPLAAVEEATQPSSDTALNHPISSIAEKHPQVTPLSMLLIVQADTENEFSPHAIVALSMESPPQKPVVSLTEPIQQSPTDGVIAPMLSPLSSRGESILPNSPSQSPQSVSKGVNRASKLNSPLGSTPVSPTNPMATTSAGSQWPSTATPRRIFSLLSDSSSVPTLNPSTDSYALIPVASIQSSTAEDIPCTLQVKVESVEDTSISNVPSSVKKDRTTRFRSASISVGSPSSISNASPSSPLSASLVKLRPHHIRTSSAASAYATTNGTNSSPSSRPMKSAKKSDLLQQPQHKRGHSMRLDINNR